ncbi:polyhydroxyalkanoate granule-associated phasin [Thauera phenolivorans]|uniref:polyhydroxyalkanoate granule-associated phasin n=1 Tax=Thauera phenolivorans TaxID=1792543 RepID=UPI0009F4B646|nr:polyhydroxyalkanoate granule-associated phasin [Thauera phenolivorans]
MTSPTLQSTTPQDLARTDATASRQPDPPTAVIQDDPVQLWTALSNQATEMMFASAQVIGHRTGRMVTAGPAPSADDLDEFSLMTQEKFEAAAESSSSVAAHWLHLNQQAWTQMCVQLQTGMTAMLSAATSWNPVESMAHHVTLFAAMSPSADAHTQFSNAAAGLTRRALEPLHARATANAERLGRPDAAEDAAS